MGTHKYIYRQASVCVCVLMKFLTNFCFITFLLFNKVIKFNAKIFFFCFFHESLLQTSVNSYVHSIECYSADSNSFAKLCQRSNAKTNEMGKSSEIDFLTEIPFPSGTHDKLYG